MSKLKIKVTLGAVLLEVEKENYRDQYEDEHEDDGDTGDGPAADIPDGFVLEKVKGELEAGDVFDDELSQAPIDDVQIDVGT
jgi:hypothetical protein